ncbi:MAG TPA: pilus assembly protein N-terminal domain-containing protein, partial [Nitrosospira sp.]|nr:pilus assembly protein N-terminal domain-containing protein [Nitrosospira sp.]
MLLVTLSVSFALTQIIPGASAGSVGPPVSPQPPLTESSSMNVTVGKSALLRLPAPIARLSVGNPDIADVALINPAQIYVLGKTIGTTNVIIWTRDSQTSVIDVTVTIDAPALQRKLEELMPGESRVKVSAAGDSLVLSGTVSDTLKADRIVSLADAYIRAATGAKGSSQRPTAQATAQGSGPDNNQAGAQGGSEGAGQGLGSTRVINLLQIGSNQQVMLEVKVAEINRTVAEKLGFDFQRAARKAGSAWTQIMTGVIGGAPAQLFQSLGNP